MKKILLTIIILGATACGIYAQTLKDGGKFSIGVEAGLPVGDAHNFSNFAIGGSLKYELPIASKTFVSLSAGYTSLLYNADYKSYLQAFDINKSAEGFIPVKAGIKYFFKEGFYGEAQAGAAFSTVKDGGAAFAYSPGVGYSFNGGFDVGVRFESWSHNGATVNQAALRVAYRL